MKYQILGFCLCFHSIYVSALIHHQHMKRSIDLSATFSLTAHDASLPNAIQPISYKLVLIPNLDQNIFQGYVKINISWHISTDLITIHGHPDFVLTQDNVKIRKISPKFSFVEEDPIIRQIDSMPKKSIYEILLQEPVERGAVCELDVTFYGKIGTLTNGLFKGSYLDEYGNTQYYLATQFMPNYARTLFPCFDEPRFKTPFSVHIARPKSYKTLFNTPVDKTEQLYERPGYVMDYFEQTLPMSTFSIGFVTSKLSQMNQTSIVSSDSPKIRIWSRKDFQMNLTDIEESIMKIMKHFKNDWSMDYPLCTLDIVALPEYSSEKIVDNSGLIVFRESDLTYDGYYVLAEELAYQWFGLWLTPKSWNDAYVTKAIARFLATSAVYEIDNGNEFEEKWPMSMSYTMMYEYARPTLRTIIFDFKHEYTCYNIELAFRMLNYTIGKETIKKGLRAVYNRIAGGTFEADDIWDGLTYHARQDNKLPIKIIVRNIMGSWIRFRLPVVTVTRNYNTNSANIEQYMFLRDRSHDLPDRLTTFWMIPIIMVTQNNLNFDKFASPIWMPEIRSIKIDNLPDKNKFIIINPEEIAPYLVNYDKHNWYLLAEYLQTEEGRKNIPVNTRAKLLHDAWNLAYSNELSFDVAFNMTLFLKWERDPDVWRPLFILIDHVRRIIDDLSMVEKYDTFTRLLLIPLYTELISTPNYGKEKREDYLRRYSDAYLCSAGYRPCVEKARAAYRNWMNSSNPDEINPVSHRYVCTVFKWGTQEEWDFGLERVINFPSSRQQGDRMDLLRALICADQKSKLDKLLNITIIEGNGNFTDGDIGIILSMLTGDSSGYTTFYHFLVNNWDAIKKRFENKPGLWDDAIRVATGSFKTSEGYNMVSTLYQQHQNEFGSAENIIKESLNSIEIEAKWSDESFPMLQKWMDQYIKSVNVKDDKYFE